MLRNAAIFTAIAWLIAASFIAGLEIMTRGVSFGLKSPETLGVMLPRSVQVSQGCDTAPGESVESATVNGRPAPFWAWRLGIAVGKLAWLSQRGSAAQNVASENARAAWALSTVLRIQPPQPFVPAHIALAHSEFTDFVESDAIPTAHELASAYSSTTCHVYKLGALWGYWVFAWTIAPGEGNGFAAQLDFHARRSGLPQRLWQPMVESTPSGTPQQVLAQGANVADAVSQYLSTQR